MTTRQHRQRKTIRKRDATGAISANAVPLSTLLLGKCENYYLAASRPNAQEFVCCGRMEEDVLREVEEFFYDRIPLTRAMGIRVVPHEEHMFAVEAPIALNHNHLHTAFGGSINAVAILAGYGLLWLTLRSEAADVVIAESSIRFLRPVRERIRAMCVKPDDSALTTLKETFRKKGKSRIKLSVRVEESGLQAAQFDATFVALRPSQS